LLIVATATVCQAADRWLRAVLQEGQTDVLEQQMWILMTGLWRAAGGEGVYQS
jgi:hypothetical protein